MTEEGGQSDGGASRRLATIVAIDAAGYSRQSEIDEAIAIREISALGERIRASAAARKGRVFNTAGDGFMLEFPSPSAAIECAEEIQMAARVPLRIGIHIGEATERPGGDLLGRGVNIAARLMQLAEPGGIVVSGDVKHALTAQVAARLKRGGVVKLDKMGERIEIFALGSGWRGRSALPRAVVITAAAAAAVLVTAAIVAFLPKLFPPAMDRVAVLEFNTHGEASLEPFAGALADRIANVMSVSDLRAIPRAQSASFRGEGVQSAARREGAAFLLDGAVRRDGDALRVSMQVIDARENFALWSSDYERAVDEDEYLQEEIAAHVVHVLRCALISRRPNAGEIDAQTLSVFLRACDRSEGGGDQNPDEMYEAARQVTEKAPRFSRGWSMLATAIARTIPGAPPEQTEGLQQEAREAAERAQRLDPGNGESYLALSMLLPVRGAWQERQALISRALKAEPDLPEAHAKQGQLLWETGRIAEAIVFYRRGAALDPLSRQFWVSLTPLYSANGLQDEADEIRRHLYRVWPTAPWAWQNRFFNAAYVGDPAEALVMLDNIGSAPSAMPPDLIACWRDWLLARQANEPEALRAAAIRMSELKGRISTASIASSLLIAGETDRGFEAFAAYTRAPDAATAPMFLAPAQRMHSDPRFMALAREVGLVDYWRETGRWPDFCERPDLGYDCEIEAARITTATAP